MSKKLTSKDMLKSSSTFKSHNDQIMHIIEEFDLELATLTSALEKSQKEYTDSLNLLSNKKEDLINNIAENKKWADNFDELIGPFEERYTILKGSIAGLYDTAKDKHEEGLKLLMEHFDYHPMFKRYNDTFTACPFKPK